jgi:hypothetical protein
VKYILEGLRKMKKNRLKVLVASAIISTVLIFGGVSAFAENSYNKENAKAKVEQAVNNKTFYNYMMAYIDILNLPQDQQGELLNQLAPLWNDVNTPKVQKARTMLENVAKNKDGKSYAETEAYLIGLSDNEMDAWTKGYLLGELTSWGKQFVFTDDYKQGVDALVNVGKNKTFNDYSKALAIINNVSNGESKKYLLNELNNLNIPKEESNSNTTNSIDYVKSISKKINSVVKIEVKDNTGKAIGTGSGFIVSTDGKVVTNFHVMKEAFSADVIMEDDSRKAVEGIISYSKERDIAVIKISGNYDPLTLADSDKVELADKIVAIGSPKGIKNTISEGIISGLNRDNGRAGKDIQFSAGITNGSSGGAVFNTKGEVIGISYSGYTTSGDLGFAIPINEAKSFITANTVINFVDFQHAIRPAAPTGVTAKAISNSEIKIQWNQVEGADYYYVYFSSDINGQYFCFKNSDGSKKPQKWFEGYSTGLYGIKSNTTRYFKITTVKDGIESDFSDVVSATTLKQADFFPKMKYAPIPSGVDYDKEYVKSDGTVAFYYYDIKNISSTFITDYRNLLINNGWKYYNSSKTSDGKTILYYKKDDNLIGISVVESYVVIFGSVQN